MQPGIGRARVFGGVQWLTRYQPYSTDSYTDDNHEVDANDAK